MKNSILILLLFALGGSFAQNDNCNFTMDLQGGVLKDSSYELGALAFTGIKKRHDKSILIRMNFDDMQMITLNVAYFQAFLSNVCVYKNHKISEVKVYGSESHVRLLLVYEKI
jgi:hypothetical protein